MIAQLVGSPIELLPNRVVLDVSGVGYDILIPVSVYESLEGKSMGQVQLFIHTQVRPESIQLFGFMSKDERSLFQELINVNGIGPKIALTILSGMDLPAVKDSVEGEDRAAFERIPGIGKKTAGRLILEMKDRLPRVFKETQGHRLKQHIEAQPHKSSLQNDTVSALTNLGYSTKVAERAAAKVFARAPELSLSGAIRAALSELM